MREPIREGCCGFRCLERSIVQSGMEQQLRQEPYQRRRWAVERERKLLFSRGVRGSSGRAAGLRKEAKARFWSIRRRLPPTTWDYNKVPDRAAFMAPAVLDFTSNYERTLAFVLDVRYLFSERQGHVCPDNLRRRVHADFSGIQALDAAAGLVLAAEIDRWSKDTGRRARSHDNSWKANVRDFFRDAGLFEMLNIDPQSVKAEPDEQPERRSLKMLSGKLADGASARKMRLDLEKLCGRDVGPRTTVYDALTEAIANVMHAYPNWAGTYPAYRIRRWWTSGSWTPSTRTMSVQLYDQGVGIPRTLPRREYWGRLLPIVRRFDPEQSDAGLIEAALEYGRTSTQIEGRGKGLSEMAEWINTQGFGFLRITSGSGSVTYNADGSIDRRNLPAAFCGTLVEWEFRFDD